ncbi:MAG: hypothetical protein LBH70_09800, partial [Spirochaetaceae bacterium]|nr:hypothetical protein [Spirochaetaceae bacterium]
MNGKPLDARASLGAAGYRGRNRSFRLFAAFVLSALIPAALAAQRHVSAPLDSSVYYILEQAQLRGLCAPRGGAKPYSRDAVLSAISEILGNENAGRGALNEGERRILYEARAAYRAPDEGLDWQRGAFYTAGEVGKNDTHISNDIGVRAESLVSGGFGDGFSWGTDTRITGFILGDLGDGFSYGFTFAGALLRAPRERHNNDYHSYYEGFPQAPDPDDPATYDRFVPTYSQPAAFFPYSYQKRWDGYVFGLSDISSGGHLSWPEGLSAGYTVLPELSGVLLNKRVRYRVGRMEREWGGMSNGSSLVFNRQAQPFLAMEAVFTPYSWLRFSTLSGILEFFNEEGIKVSAASNQNAFSLSMIELDYKQFLHFDAGTSVVWPKRFELGYMVPLVNAFFYQSNIGDFDNLGIFFNLKAQYPGIAGLWFSLFLDEVSVEKRMFELDRSMYAFQTGAQAYIPGLPFSSLSLRYTKIEPYCYTHTREIVPWYGGTPMETAYTNNGEGLGYYLPPNSDELLLRFEAMPLPQTRAHLQYQMIRHGADYGSAAVDGSSFLSEL